MSVNNTRFLLPEQLEEEFKIKKSHQANLRSKKKIPYVKLGSYIYYDINDIYDWLNSHKVQTIDVRS